MARFNILTGNSSRIHVFLIRLENRVDPDQMSLSYSVFINKDKSGISRTRVN